HLDMESDTPMDRLVCGDVGYGKTEVAIRAAFKAVNDGKQVAFVVPTTILAEQHLSTFKNRFANYPFNIECLSRFRSKKEQTDILKKMHSGLVDIVIGTHRLLQKDIDFKSLGLLIIDEEQRFGVKHKEALKKKRSNVDVLALTATPIPRTLHMSLTGMRDISVISTAPADRQPIVSYISEYEETIVKDAIQKEIARKGQVFFVHNNIKTIFKMAENIETLVPDAKVGVAHGRLSEIQLEQIMLKFVNFEIDVLVCTTIIESGLDIPSANTMIINKAERFGLSQIYQLRGRIGRGDHQAYAYLFISDENQLTKDAKKRLSALMEHRDLGSGFQIAMKDLQIRGAGTALGASQSGHIAAVGYDMFLKLLDNAVHDLKGEEVSVPLEPEINVAISSGFADDYIESVEQRLTIYRRLSKIINISDIKDMQKELTDRYGKLPKEAENMLLKIMLRVYCIKAGVQRLDITPNALTIAFSEKHREKSLDSIHTTLKKLAVFKFIKKETIKIQLGSKRNKISRSVLETRNILKAIS
ncbi:MAG: DEAD/DEAH box helicase, partial [Desulfobacula sp.]|nr:DEAD/DEAH box helicase [Desulfobacula sp.]